MKGGWIICSIAAAIILLIGIGFYISNKNNVESEVNDKIVKMEVKSVFKQGEKIPVKYTADGRDVNPLLKISGIPDEAESLVLIVDDPDAPAGVWVHWLVFNIPVFGSEFRIEEESIPGVQGINSWEHNDYGGPSPPSGIHRYFFKIYALDIKDLGLDSSADKSDVEGAMREHILDKAELMGVYERK